MMTPLRRFLPVLLVAALTSSCGSKATNECDAFLEGYEKYVNDYIELAQQAQSNPTDMTLMQKAADMSVEAQKWASKGTSCENDPDFIEKYTKIQGKLANAAIGL